MCHTARALIYIQLLSVNIAMVMAIIQNFVWERVDNSAQRYGISNILCILKKHALSPV
jgi:hypothetical protein